MDFMHNPKHAQLNAKIIQSLEGEVVECGIQKRSWIT